MRGSREGWPPEPCSAGSAEYFERRADMEDELVRNADECGENCLECLKCVGAEKVQDEEREAGV